MSGRELKTAIIGCGNIFTMHATPLSVMKNVKLVGVCDVKKDRADAAAEKYSTAAYYDYKKLITEQKPDIVHVCVPHYMHPVITKFALGSGVNVLSEKPMSIHLKDGEENVALAKKNGLRYGVIFQCRYNDASQFIKRVLDSGELGKIISARSTLSWSRSDDYYSLSDWKGTWDKEGGGVIIDQAIHSMDLVNWFISDKPVSVSASIANRGHKLVEVDDSADGLITYANGMKYAFWAMNNYGCDEPIEIRLFCERGKATLSYDDATVEFSNGKKLYVRQGEDSLKYDGGKDYWGFRHARQIEEFYSAVREGHDPEISGEEALKIQKIICAVYESGKSGKTVLL